MIEALTQWGVVASAWAQPVGVGLIAYLAFTVRDIRSNHLVHIYDVLEELCGRKLAQRLPKRRSKKES